jgi:hypothetical protein
MKKKIFNTNEIPELVKTIVEGIDEQEDPRNRIITNCRVVHNKEYDMYDVIVRSNCDGWAESTLTLFSYSDDEYKKGVNPSSLIGKTEHEALQICKDTTKCDNVKH